MKFKTASHALPNILSQLLEHGDEVGSRNGRVLEIMNAQIVLTEPRHREILNVNRKANVFAQIAETMWVLSGRNDIEWLGAYLPRAKDYSDDGETWRGGYGPRIREWGGWPHQNNEGRAGIDQLAHVVDTLRADPLSRRAVIAIYDPATDIPAGKDVPCNDFLQFQNRDGKLHLTVTVRSNDVMWGWSGINAFEWSTLQEIVAHLLGIGMGTLTFNIGSLHLYQQHWNKARGIERQSSIFPGPAFETPETMSRTVDTVNNLLNQWFDWEEKCCAGEATLSGLEKMEEPLFKSWAAAIAYYWQREDHWLKTFAGTGLAIAVASAPASVLPEPRVASRSNAAGQGHNIGLHERTRAFYGFVTDLHAKKHASYGNSWRKRGEMMSILPNMARKVDRLGVGDEFDSSADTLIDLLVYAIKYECWLDGHTDAGPTNVNLRLGHYLGEAEEVNTEKQAVDIALADIVDDFDHYADNFVARMVREKREFVSELITRLAPIARDVWWAERIASIVLSSTISIDPKMGITIPQPDGNAFFLPADGGDQYRGMDMD